MGDTLTRPREEAAPRQRADQPWLWNVVLLDSDDHSYEYVIDMLQRIFGHPPRKGFRIAETVDREGRAVCLTTHRELAELKLEQIRGFGADPRVASCSGAMSAILEPAGSGDDDPDA